MSIESEEEGSAARSNVAAKDGKIPTFTYSREEMMTLREVKLSRSRPDYLGIDFDGDDNLFSPFKWLQHKWEEEGVKDRPMTRKNEMMREEGESTVLSPQRRAFSSGCRAPEDKGAELEDGKEKGRTWRQGAAKTDYNNKFKAERDRNDKRGGSSWRNERWNDGKTDKDRPNKYERDRKNMGRRDDDRVEKLPEWADGGPTSVNDLIELKGFDEPKKKKERGKSEKKQDSPKNDSRPPSNPSPTAPTTEDTTSLPIQQSFPKSDEEFAKFLGLLDNNDQNGQQSDILNDIMNTGNTEESHAATGSRLSRFFKTRAQNDDANINAAGQNGQRRGSGENERESILSRIFEHNNAATSKSNDVPKQMEVPPRSGGPMTLEDLERSLKPAIDARTHFGEHHAKASLQDPREQATLMSKLQRMARDQDGWNGGVSAPPHAPPPHSVPPVAGMPPSMAAAMGMNPMMRDPAYLAHALVQSQYNVAMMKAATALQGPVPPHIQERIRQAAEANFVAAHHAFAGKMALAQTGINPQAAAHAMAAAASVAQQHQETKRHQTTSLIPASVQKKASVIDEKKEKSRHEEETEKADMARRAVMQQQYTNMMTAMQGGLSMNAYRAAAAAPVDGSRGNHPGQSHIAAMSLASQQKARKVMPMHPSMGHEELSSHSQPMQNPLEKLLAAAGVQPKEVRASGPPMQMHHHMGMANARPISLEELERSLTMK